jgi:hypothetical protein
LTGDIDPEPIVEPITNAEVEDSRSTETAGLADGHIVVSRTVGVENVLHFLIAESDIAPQIPSAEILDRRRRIHRRRRHDGGHVGCECR